MIITVNIQDINNTQNSSLQSFCVAGDVPRHAAQPLPMAVHRGPRARARSRAWLRLHRAEKSHQQTQSSGLYKYDHNCSNLLRCIRLCFTVKECPQCVLFPPRQWGDGHLNLEIFPGFSASLEWYFFTYNTAEKLHFLACTSTWRSQVSL